MMWVPDSDTVVVRAGNLVSHPTMRHLTFSSIETTYCLGKEQIWDLGNQLALKLDRKETVALKMFTALIGQILEYLNHYSLWGLESSKLCLTCLLGHFSFSYSRVLSCKQLQRYKLRNDEAVSISNNENFKWCRQYDTSEQKHLYPLDSIGKSKDLYKIGSNLLYPVPESNMESLLSSIHSRSGDAKQLAHTSWPWAEMPRSQSWWSQQLQPSTDWSSHTDRMH